MEKQYRLPEEFAEKWLAAPRSGEYEQCQEGLHNGVGYCCLGVACALAGASNDEMMESACFPIELPTKLELPKLLLANSNGFQASNPKQKKFIFKLAQMNDTQNKTFPEIADWIESNCDFY